MTQVDCKCQIPLGIEPHEPSEDVSHYCNEDSFAAIVGCIESIVISEPFLALQNRFLENHYEEFVEDDENRLIYMDIFKWYLATVEKYIEDQLIKNIPGFDIRNFENELEQKPNELDCEIYEMLSTFWDFNTFKQMFLEYKKMKEGTGIDFSQDITVTKYTVDDSQEKLFI